MDSQDTERKNSMRLSALERKLDNVIESNIGLQSMLETVLKNLSGTDAGEDRGQSHPVVPILGETSENMGEDRKYGLNESRGRRSSDHYWDVLLKTSDEDEQELNVSAKMVDSGNQRVHKVIVYYSSDFKNCYTMYRNGFDILISQLV